MEGEGLGEENSAGNGWASQPVSLIPGKRKDQPQKLEFHQDRLFSIPQENSTDLIRIFEQYTASLYQLSKILCNLHNRSLLWLLSFCLMWVCQFAEVSLCFCLALCMAYTHREALNTIRVCRGRYLGKGITHKGNWARTSIFSPQKLSTIVSLSVVPARKMGRWNVWAWNMSTWVLYLPNI